MMRSRHLAAAPGHMVMVFCLASGLSRRSRFGTKAEGAPMTTATVGRLPLQCMA